jgi:hypothetical protein
MPKLLNITGQRFGRLVALELQGRYQNRALWLCQCDCGNTTIVRSCHLVNGRTKSCGCLQRELTVALLTTHGQTGTPTYRAWLAMLQRCCNPKNKAYRHYGGRGVGIDDPNWFSYQRFFDEMGEKPPGAHLHRKDNDKGYSRDNCVWLSASEHARLHNFRRWSQSVAA